MRPWTLGTGWLICGAMRRRIFENALDRLLAIVTAKLPGSERALGFSSDEHLPTFEHISDQDVLPFLPACSHEQNGCEHISAFGVAIPFLQISDQQRANPRRYLHIGKNASGQKGTPIKYV